MKPKISNSTDKDRLAESRSPSLDSGNSPESVYAKLDLPQLQAWKESLLTWQATESSSVSPALRSRNTILIEKIAKRINELSGMDVTQ